jgi:hypothetical protein
MSEACVRLTPAGHRAIYVRDSDEVALAIAHYMQEERGEPFYLDQIDSVPKEAWRWVQDRSNEVFLDGKINPEICGLLAEWNPKR